MFAIWYRKPGGLFWSVYAAHLAAEVERKRAELAAQGCEIRDRMPTVEELGEARQGEGEL